MEDDLFGGRKPWVPAREIIDWSLTGQSIYDRARPLSAKTLARIEAGLKRYGLSPFVAAWDHQSSVGVWSQDQPLSTVTTKARHGVVEPFLVPHFGERPGQAPRCLSVNEPLPTGQGAGSLVQPFLIEMRGTSDDQVQGSGRDIQRPLGTVTAGGIHHALIEPALLGQQSGSALRPVSQPAPTVATSGAIALVEPYIIKYYGTGGPRPVTEPLDTVTTKDRHALVRPTVRIQGENYLLDIRFRMLQPHELAAAQGFRKEYVFTGTKAEQVKQIGNAVPRRLARALVAAAMTQRSDVGWLNDSGGNEA
jgi:DNA (cytosine-5)-methyltransferase 1